MANKDQLETIDYPTIKTAIDVSREYDRAIDAAYMAADSRDIDRLYNHIAMIVKEHAAGYTTDLQAIRALQAVS